MIRRNFKDHIEHMSDFAYIRMIYYVGFDLARRWGETTIPLWIFLACVSNSSSKKYYDWTFG